ncbi:class I SAM-dependent methyltransferase [Agromyces bauzanensis]
MTREESLRQSSGSEMRRVMSPANSKPAAGYVEWKGWGADGFGKISPGDSDYFSRELRRVVRRRPVRRVLEIGFGNGVFLGYCRSQGWSVVGTELLPELVDMARNAGFEAYGESGLSSLPDESFDLVVALDVFEHIQPEQSVAFLQTITSKLVRGGALFLRFPNADSWIGNPFQYGDVTHVNAIGALKVEYYANAAGLEVVELRATRRRGFRTSVIHGVHAYTAGVAVKLIAGIAKALYFPDLRVVLSSSNVVCVLRKPSEHP